MTDPNISDPNDAAATAAADAPQSVDAPAAGTADGADDQLARLQRERDDLYDRLLRKSAEFENYRKRVDKERRDQAEWAAADILMDVLSVLDDFDRALATEAPAEAQSYRTGVELIHRQLGEMLRKRGVTPIDTLGADFDPHVHQAVAYE